ncbi:hypothetical protein EJ06DRAFT_491966 [Trichodelitschia bisporula]|uniref:Signal recognition particle subunit SRP68 n=1 Tax=Trichodelitschia bisporula TaxID=703511 RepID=A0A6G1I1J3_9PEZI|nr:hypothetical protein EJ06DRAFT_491966 [Trichodelitschia bisporula]
MNITEFVVSHRESAFLAGDHGAYRAQLSRQLAAARRKLGRATPKNAKFTPKAPVTAEDIGANKEFVHLVLLTAERAWAHAMSIKSTGEDAASQSHAGSRRKHVVTCLNKAAKHAKELAELLGNQAATGASDKDVLEAQAYRFSLSGAEEFEKHATSQRGTDAEAQREKWQECLVNFSAARVAYSALLKATKQELFKDLISGTIDPSIRFAAYQSHIPRTVPSVSVARRLFPDDDEDLTRVIKAVDPTALGGEGESADKAGDKFPTSISWRSRKANIVDASIGQAIAAVRAAEEQLSATLSGASPDLPLRDRAAAYDDVMTAAQDASDATRHAIEEHEKEKISESDPRMQDLRVTSLAVNYELIGWRVGRNRVLIGADDGLSLEGPPARKPKRPRKDGKEWTAASEGNGRKVARLRERIVLYDAILQSIDSIKDLRGAARDATFVEELDGRRAYFQALKCLNIAYSHALISNYREALSLLLRAQSLATTVVSTLKDAEAPTPIPKLDVQSSLAKSLHEHLLSLVYHFHGVVELRKITDATTAAAKKQPANPVIKQLHEYPVAGTVDLKNIVTWPPKLQPVPVKPLFLDVAWNYIDYPGRSPAVAVKDTSAEEKQQEEEKKSTKSRWFPFGR